MGGFIKPGVAHSSNFSNRWAIPQNISIVLWDFAHGCCNLKTQEYNIQSGQSRL